MAFEYHPAVMAADATDYQAGTLKRIGNAVAYGGASAAASGAMSIYNSFLGLGRGLGLTDAEDVNTLEVVRRYGGDEMGNYYEENKNAIDIVGFVGTSLIPASIGIKGLQLARAGVTTGNVGKALNLFPSKKHEYLQAALQETAQGGGVIARALGANRLKYTAWEAADQVSQAAAAEALIGITMWNSPVFTGDSLGDMGWNAVTGMALGGVIGGAVGSIAAGGIMKAASKQIQEASRLGDIVTDASKLGVAKGTEAMVIAESLLTAPKNFSDLSFKYKLDGKEHALLLKTEDALEHNYLSAQRLGYDKLALKFNELAGGDAVRGQAYYEFLTNGIEASKAAGLSGDEIAQRVTGYLSNLKQIEHLDLEKLELDKRKFYLTLRPDPVGGKGSKFLNIISPERTVDTTKQAYRLADDVTASELTVVDYADLGVGSIKQAFKQNPEMDILRLADGTIRVNPTSTKILRHRENPVQARQLIDLETGDIVSETAAVIGDIMQPGRWATRIDAIEVNGTTYKQAGSHRLSLADSSLESSARWAWASKLTAPQLRAVSKDVIHEYDFPMLSRLAELVGKGEVKLEDLDIVIKGDAGQQLLSDVAADAAELNKFINQRRTEWAELEYINWEEGMGSVPDIRVMAAHLNTDYKFVEELIESGFDPAIVGNGAGRVMTTEEAFKPRTIMGVWDFGTVAAMPPLEAFKINMGPAHQVTRELTTQYQVQTRRLINQRSAEAVLGEDAAQFRPADELLSRDADIRGAGASLFGASNAGYEEKARLWVQNTGRAVAQTTQKWQERTIGALTPYINAIRADERAAAELGIVTHMLRGSKRQYVFEAPQNSMPTILREAPERLVSREVLEAAAAQGKSVDEILETLPADARHPHVIPVKDPNVAGFLRDTAIINSQRQDKFTTLLNAAGLTRKSSPHAIVYAPPVDTVRYPYHAIVKTKAQPGLATDSSMIVAKSEEELRAKVATLGDDYDVFYKKDTDNYFKIRGEYEYGNAINEARVNSDLARRGVLDGFLPETRFENVMTDWLKWHGRQDEKLVRNAVETQSRQFFSELQFLSENYRKTSESVARGIGSLFKAKVADPFGDYIKTALNISKQQEFPLLDSLNEFVDKLGVAAGEALNKARADATSGIISWEEANKMLKAKGYGGVYDNAEQYFAFNTPAAKNVVKAAFQKGNMILATTMLRLDFANSLVNMISTPIMISTEMQSIKRLIKDDQSLLAQLKDLTSVKVPGEEFSAPSTMKLLIGAVNNYFGPNKGLHMTRYENMGAIKSVNRQYHDMLDLATYDPVLSANKFSEQMNAAVEKASKITFNSQTEDLTRFISADVMRQLTDPLVTAGKMTIKEQDAYIGTFVNRVQGNYVTSQRPVVFQGTTGAAVSLFQTYAFNVLQQLYRHIENKDARTLAVFAGLQTTMFGMNGLPFFEAINTHLIGGNTMGLGVQNNPEHKDLYSVLPGFNKELGDWMLYGTASAFPFFSDQAPALFTRGDINPRHALVLPTAAADIPVVSASIKAAKAVYDTGKNIMGGADLSDALLQGLEHQGLNRPLAGFAQVLAGQSTDKKGALISANLDMSATAMLAGGAERSIVMDAATRLLGARPMDEAVALNAMYRNKSYQAMDRARIERLGEVVKTKLYRNELPTTEEYEDFMLRYVRAGGRIENFNNAMQRWTRDANVSIVNQLAEKNGSPYATKLQEIMGGEAPADYRSLPPVFESDPDLGQ